MAFPPRRSATIALVARIDRPAFQPRAADRIDARLARDPGGGLEFFQEYRSGKVVALRIADLGGGLQVGEFLERFDAFRDHRHAERLAQRLDRPQDTLAARALVNVGDERTVD